MSTEIGDRFSKHFMCKGCLDGSTSVEDKYTEEVCHTGTKDRQRKTGDVLVCTQRDGQNTVDQSAKSGRNESADQRNQNDQQH